MATSSPEIEQLTVEGLWQTLGYTRNTRDPILMATKIYTVLARQQCRSGETFLGWSRFPDFAPRYRARERSQIDFGLFLICFLHLLKRIPLRQGSVKHS